MTFIHFILYFDLIYNIQNNRLISDLLLVLIFKWMKFQSDYINDRFIKKKKKKKISGSFTCLPLSRPLLRWFFSIILLFSLSPMKPETTNLIFSPFHIVLSLFFPLSSMVTAIFWFHFDAFIFINCQQENKKKVYNSREKQVGHRSSLTTYPFSSCFDSRQFFKMQSIMIL